MIRASLACVAVLMTLVAAPAQAAFPGEPGPIAYSKAFSDEVAEGRVESKGGLFTHGPRIKQKPRQLTGETGDHSPSYSADGRLIVFVHDDHLTGKSSIYAMRNDGSERKEVTLDGLGGASPSFFPGGEAIVFSRRVDGRSHIFSIRVDGSGLRQLTFGPYDDHDPVVSPNGRRIAFGSNRDPDAREDRSDIFAMRADGSRIRVLIDGPRRDSEPDWAPDGRRIAYIVSRLRGKIFVANLGSGRTERLTNCEGIRCRSYSHPAFSPDGRHIVALGSGSRIDVIAVVRSDGRNPDSFDYGSVEEEGFGTTLGPPTWGPVIR